MNIHLKTTAGILFAVFVSCSSSSIQQKDELPEKVVSVPDTCDGPDSDINCCFVNMPDNVSEIMVIAGENEPGERLIISGKVLKKDGVTPVRDVIIYAYQTNAKGIYAKAGNERGFQKWHGKLHGWCKTNSEGWFEIHSIRPASYPNSTAPAHIHAAVKFHGRQKPFYIKDFVFDDDPFVNENFRAQTQYGEGGSGVVSLQKIDGVWVGTRDLVMTQD